MPLLGSSANGDSPPAENAAEQALTARALPPFSFGKSQPQIIERIKTEIAGAQFVDKIAPPKKRVTEEDDAKGMDIQDLLQPKKKAKKAAGKAKAKASAKAAACPGEDAEDEQGKARAAAIVSEFGSERARWWIDDVIFCLSHAAGGFSATSCKLGVVRSESASLQTVHAAVQLPMLCCDTGSGF